MPNLDSIKNAEVLTEAEMAEIDKAYPPVDWAAPLTEDEIEQLREASKTRYGRVQVARFKAHREAMIAKGQN
jgi:hypothetical protein